MDPRGVAPPYAAAEQTLREVIEALAPIRRAAGSDGERRAAEWIAARLDAAGCEAALEEESFLDGYARVMRSLSAVSALAGVVAAGAATGRARPRGVRSAFGARGARSGAGARGARGARGAAALRAAALLTAAAVTAAIVDDVSNGPRVYRRLRHRFAPPRTTVNVVGRVGSPTAPRTLVVLAHHDAAPTGAIFDQRAQEWVGDRFPRVLELTDTSLPLWWALLCAPALVAQGALSGRRVPAVIGAAGSLLAIAVFHDIARSPIVPGANDNLTAVAVLVALAQRLRARPIPGLQVMLVSCGAEEVIQGGIHGFARRHFPGLDRTRTWFLNLETVGSPRLIMLEGEGPVRMRDYHDPGFRELVARTAQTAGVPLRRGMRSRNSTDAVIPSRAGYPTVTLASMNRYKALSHYHLMSDVPDNVDYSTVLRALTLTEAVAAQLAAQIR